MQRDWMRLSLTRDYALQVHRLQSQGGAVIIMHGEDCVEAEMRAAQEASEKGAVYISPYNDMNVRAPGQGFGSGLRLCAPGLCC